MSADGSAIDSKGEEMEKVNPASGSKISKEPVQSEAKENMNLKSELTLKVFSSDKNKDMPEVKKMGKPMVGLPPINVNELTTILQDPAMPSQDLMKEIAQKIKIRNEENESKAAAVNTVNPLGIRSVFDCIMEVTLSHADDSSDEEGEEHEPRVLEIPCDYCKKIFGSTMSLKTHVLMSHSKDDPSVLNVRLRASLDDDNIFQQSVGDGLKKDTKTEIGKQGEQDVKRRQRKPSGNIGKGVICFQSLVPVEKCLLDDSKKQGPISELSGSDKILAPTSPSALDSTDINSPSNPSRSSLRKRKFSTEKPDMNKCTVDLTHVAKEASELQPSSSALPQSTPLSARRGKRKSDNTSSSPNIKKEKQSRRSMSDEREDAIEKPSVQVRRSSRRK